MYSVAYIMSDVGYIVAFKGMVIKGELSCHQNRNNLGVSLQPLHLPW